MAGSRRPVLSPEPTRKRQRRLKPLDLSDPNDYVFDLVSALVDDCCVSFASFANRKIIGRELLTCSLFPPVRQITTYDVPITVAIKSGITCSITAMYARVARWRSRKDDNTEASLAACALLDLATTASELSPIATNKSTAYELSPNATNKSTASELHPNATNNNVSPTQPSSGKAPTKKPADQLPSVTPSQSARKASNITLGKARSAAISTIPAWMDRETTTAALGKTKQRTITQTTQDNFDKKSINGYYQTRHSNAWKGGTKYYNDILRNPKLRGKRGFGARSIADRLNKTILNSPNDRKIGKSAFERAVQRGEFGVSPPKRGHKSIVPENLTKTLATHATMMQISGEGEASRPKMMATLHALVAGTKWDEAFSLDYVYRKMRTEHPEMLNPVRAKNHEDRRVDWLSYNNIIKWNDRAKQFLVEIGMAKDEPGMIREYHILILCDIILSFTNLVLISCLLIYRRRAIEHLSHSPG